MCHYFLNVNRLSANKLRVILKGPCHLFFCQVERAKKHICIHGNLNWSTKDTSKYVIAFSNLSQIFFPRTFGSRISG